VILGTFVLQNPPPGQDNSQFQQLIQLFFLDNIFQSWWFNSLLALMALSLGLVLIKRKPFRMTQAGFLFSHLGVILILIGGLVGRIFGTEGFIELHEGKSADAYQRVENGYFVNSQEDLGFQLKLDDFQVDFYEGKYKLYAYIQDSEIQNYRSVASYDITESNVEKIPGSNTVFEIARVETIQKKEHGHIHEFPLLTLLVKTPSGVQEEKLTYDVERPLFVEGGKFALLIDKRDGEVREYRSVASIIDNGQVIRKATIAVNHPLKYAGFSFYQSNYKPEDLTYSGFQVIRDPGLGTVYTGAAMLCLGVIWIFYITPAYIRGKRKEGQNVVG
jgi:cytochrome c biogenesis protein